MSHLLTRELICERLRISRSACYRLLDASRMSLISSDKVCDLLNRSRQGEDMVTLIPSDLVTAEELAVMIAPELHGITKTLRFVKLSSRHVRNPMPHFRLNSHVWRYRVSSVRKWLDDFAKKERS